MSEQASGRLMKTTTTFSQESGSAKRHLVSATRPDGEREASQQLRTALEILHTSSGLSAMMVYHAVTAATRPRTDARRHFLRLSGRDVTSCHNNLRRHRRPLLALRPILASRPRGDTKPPRGPRRVANPSAHITRPERDSGRPALSPWCRPFLGVSGVLLAVVPSHTLSCQSGSLPRRSTAVSLF
ncbi:unnamed protein product [Arctogadus glacialis]